MYPQPDFFLLRKSPVIDLVSKCYLDPKSHSMSLLKSRLGARENHLSHSHAFSCSTGDQFTIHSSRQSLRLK